MRVTIPVLLFALGAVGTAAAQSDTRYNASAESSAGASSSRFSDLFSTESSRYGDSRATAPSPKSPSANSGSSVELRPLRGSTNTTPSASTQSPRRTTTPSTPSRTQPNSQLRTPTRESTPARSNATAADSRAGRYSGGSSNRSTPSTFGQRPEVADNRRGSVERSIAVGGRREASADAMLRDMLKPPANSRLTGTPTRLASVVERAASREEQGRAVEEYWALTAATIDYYLGLAEAQELGRLRQRVPTYSAALSEALVGLNTRVDTSLQAARAAQMRLGKLMGGGANPLPIDVPFCGPYATRFSQNFPGGGAEEARLLNELLPARLAELHAAADAVERSNDWLSKVAKARSSGDGAGMIRALELVALNRRAFVMLARDYNLQINRYTQLTAPGERVDTNRLVAMLIRTGGPSSGLGRSVAGGGLEFRSGAASRR